MNQKTDRYLPNQTELRSWMSTSEVHKWLASVWSVDPKCTLIDYSLSRLINEIVSNPNRDWTVKDVFVGRSVGVDCLHWRLWASCEDDSKFQSIDYPLGLLTFLGMPETKLVNDDLYAFKYQPERTKSNNSNTPPMNRAQRRKQMKIRR